MAATAAPPFLFDLPPAYVRAARLHSNDASSIAVGVADGAGAASTSAARPLAEPELEGVDGEMDEERRTCNTCEAAFEDIYEQVQLSRPGKEQPQLPLGCTHR
jgi:hypothetical protein